MRRGVKTSKHKKKSSNLVVIDRRTAKQMVTSSSPKKRSGVFGPSSGAMLLIGEGDFSFALALLVNLGTHKMIATSYDSKSDVLAKYPTAAMNIRGLERAGISILYGIDVTKDVLIQKIVKSTDIPIKQVIFNFPHIGGGSTDKDVQANQEFLRLFFQWSVKLLSHFKSSEESSEICVTLRDSFFYNSWDIKAQAETFCNLKCIKEIAFLPKLFPGYKSQRSHPSATRTAPPTSDKSTTFVFKIY